MSSLKIRILRKRSRTKMRKAKVMLSEPAKVKGILREKAFEAALTLDNAHTDADGILNSAKRFYDFLSADLGD